MIHELAHPLTPWADSLTVHYGAAERLLDRAEAALPPADRGGRLSDDEAAGIELLTTLAERHAQLAAIAATVLTLSGLAGTPGPSAAP